MNNPKASLDQWSALQAVIDYGGFAAAAKQLNRSQSSVSHAVNKLQDLLGYKILYIEGRKARLTPGGEIILQRSRQLIADAKLLEQQAQHLQQGWGAEIRFAVEAALPTEILLESLKQFESVSQQTRINLQEVVLSGAEDVLLNNSADLVISPYIPQGFMGEELIRVKFRAVAHSQHNLFKLNRELSKHDLKRETQVIVSDSGSKKIDAGWLSNSKRWAVHSLESAKKIISSGLGYGWLPENEIKDKLENNQLKLLPLIEGSINMGNLFLVYADINRIGPATKQFAEILTRTSKEYSQKCQRKALGVRS